MPQESTLNMTILATIMSLFLCHTTCNFWISFVLSNGRYYFKVQERTMNTNQLFDYNVSFFFGKVHCNLASYITRLHKGSIHIITCSSCTCAPFFTVHCPFPVSSLRASVHSQQRFSLPPTHCSDWNLCLALRLLLMFTVYLARPERISSRSLLILTPLYLYVFQRLITYIIVLYWTRSHSFTRFRECGTAILLPNKRSVLRKSCIA